MPDQTPSAPALHTLAPVARLTAELVALDSRSSVSNLAVAERIEAALPGFDVDRVDYTDANGVAKRCLVAHRGPPGGYALSGHKDTVPDTGWQTNPWDPRVDAQGVMHGLGSVDMKGPVAACVMAALAVGPSVPATLLITTDEETTKAGARAVAASDAARRLGLTGIVVAEPTPLAPVRGHRSSINFLATAKGVQAHSSTGQGLNANWALIPFLAEMKTIHEKLRHDPALHDQAYAPPFSDFNLVVDNHGTAVNVNVPLASCRIKFRYSRSLDPKPILAEGAPPELTLDHPLIQLARSLTGKPALTVPFGTDASELQEIAPCVILGPGGIETAHTPFECVPLDQLDLAVGLFRRFLEQGV